ncbi:probable phospholipid-transporting ATPase IF isoform X1 [Heterocephalus glaber]|uniref:Phospholipid-transporting ATPase n=1 Tax=Heterocephalus glaber TaxID=10181 RepID=A0AAX6SMN7_HETGA|nr:probable phospholipid-transporting ATPase IF isoform X1 [Heterocephalus glaber]XP_021110475.1 probable phospholipid-transporting ATPase IF isoform X1 [Heterocephalus glaber]
MWRWVRQQLGLDPPHQSDTRTIYIANRFPQNGLYTPQKFIDNRIISSKYTVWNFVPKNLFEQFRRVANFYFLIIFLVQLMIDTPTSPITSGLPLFFVITVTAIKQGYEDWLRHNSDNEVNGAPVYVVRSGGLVKTRSKNIRVGDIVRIAKDEIFPADLVLLSSDRPDGSCHITTASLDGETNLKTHVAVPETAVLQTVANLDSLIAVIECQQPEADLYRFMGRMIITQQMEEIVRPLGPESLLLRGARLKNTKEIFGVAVYTGMETKMALNYKSKSQKRSAVEKLTCRAHLAFVAASRTVLFSWTNHVHQHHVSRSMNTFLIIYLIILISEAIISTILKYTWQAEEKWNEPWYNQKTEHQRNSSKILRFISDFLAFLVLYNFIIPISLYVTVEMQKFLGSFFIGWDLDLYHEESDQKAQVNTSDLNEELGQVNYVFTDKTGTLTENEMQFRECSINGIKYQEINGRLVPEGPTPDSSEGNLSYLSGLSHLSNLAHLTSSSSFRTSPENENELIKEHGLFFKAVSLCHTVQISNVQSDGIGDGPWQSSLASSQLEYYASSPDEKALVEAAARIGIVFIGNSEEIMEIKILGKLERYRLLHVLEFDSDRRRMSVIVQACSGEKLLFAKGAESSILPNCIGGDIEKTRIHVDEFALKGLRTLCIAYRQFTPNEYEEIDRRLFEARTALQQREEKLAEVFQFIEKDLILLGATAVEDRLQDKVQETIEALRMAGIKVWVLTGDKHETAVSVSLSCGHFHRTMNILELINQKSDNECAEQLRQLARRITEDHVIQHGLVVDGTSLSLALREHEKLFMEVCRNCSAVLCCRMAPLQKAKVIRLIKISPEKPITLAVGDGANDVSMIQEAHVGIGIMGKEGRQAARNSDYAIARFKFLSKLLFVHGHFYYIRIATLVQYFFYKNVCFITPQFLYQFYCLFSQQTLYDSMYLTLYNICFTSLPVLIYSLLEQHIDPHVLQNKPTLYRDISKNHLLSIKTFLYWTILGFSHAFIFFFGSYFLMGKDTSLLGNGQMFGNWTFGTLVFTVMVITVTAKMALETHFWTWINHLVTWGSIIFYFIFSLFYSGILWPFLSSQNMYFVFIQLLSSGSTWFAITLMVVTCLFLDIVKKVFGRHLHPTSTEKAQMEEDKGSVSSAYEFAECQHRGEDSGHLLAEACSQQDSCWRTSLLKQIQVSSAWTPCAVSQKEKQHVHLLEECWNEL